MSGAGGNMRTRGGWHLSCENGTVTLARRLPARFDIAAEAAFPAVRAHVLAHEVRKDLWRSLRKIKGLSPVVRVDRCAGGLHLRAGARLDGPRPPTGAEARIAALLDDPARRARWIAHARRPNGPYSK